MEEDRAPWRKWKRLLAPSFLIAPAPFMTMKILLLSLEFAPVQTTGAFRPIAAAKYLREFGVEPVVVTIDIDCAKKVWHANDNGTLLRQLHSDLVIYRLKPGHKVRQLGPRRSMLQRLTRLDDGFYKMFRKSLVETIRNNSDFKEVTTVLVSVPPFGAAQLGVEAARILSVPLILDARDAWTQSDSGMPAPSYLHYLAQKRSEATAISRCNAFLTVTERLRQLYARDHSELPLERQFVIANGFDGPAFEASPVAAPPADETFDIAYVGNFYGASPQRTLRGRVIRPHLWLSYSVPGDDWTYRGPQHFFCAWRKLVRSHPEMGRRIRFHLIGPIPANFIALASEYGLESYCKTWGVVPKQQVGEILSTMHAMLATSMKRPDGGDFCLASKTFDYVLAKKPVLAFVCEGSQRDFLERAGITVLCDPDDPVGSAETLRKTMTEGVSLRLNADYVNQFHRREAARRMADVIFEVTRHQRTDDTAPAESALSYI